MNRRQILSGAAGAALGIGALMSASPRAEAGDAPADLHVQCAKACADCMASCEMCVKHCTNMLASGVKGHEHTLQLAADCGEICTSASRIVYRQGPLMATICDACAKACDACGAACAKYPDMKTMQDCVKATRQSAKLCRQMMAKHS